jgi:hypothetical protein
MEKTGSLSRCPCCGSDNLARAFTLGYVISQECLAGEVEEWTELSAWLGPSGVPSRETLGEFIKRIDQDDCFVKLRGRALESIKKEGSPER